MDQNSERRSNNMFKEFNHEKAKDYHSDTAKCARASHLFVTACQRNDYYSELIALDITNANSETVKSLDKRKKSKS